MSRHRHSRRKSRSKGRHRASRGSRRAKRSQSRRGIRASSRGFRKAKRRGRTSVTTRKFMKLRRHARNPGGVYHRTLRDGSKVTVRDDGEIVVHDERGAEYDRYRVKPYEVNRVLKGLGTGKYATKGHYHYDSVQDDYQSLSRNPRGHRGHRKKHRRPQGVLRSTGKLIRGHGRSYRSYGGPGSRKYRHARRNCGGSMRNPAQFPMPFVSAMNPRRRRGKRRGRRNPPIRRKDARAMKRVLRTHHYRCR